MVSPMMVSPASIAEVLSEERPNARGGRTRSSVLAFMQLAVALPPVLLPTVLLNVTLSVHQVGRRPEPSSAF